MPIGASSAPAISKAQRVKQFVSLRTQGLSYRAIAEAWQKQTGKKISQTTVQTDIVAELQKIAEQTRWEAKHYQQLELTRLDMAMSAIAKQVAAGEVNAVNAWVKISESRRKLLGLDAPVQLQVQQQLATQQDQFINMLEAALDAETFAKVTAAAVAIAEASAAAETN